MTEYKRQDDVFLSRCFKLSVKLHELSVEFAMSAPKESKNLNSILENTEYHMECISQNIDVIVKGVQNKFKQFTYKDIELDYLNNIIKTNFEIGIKFVLLVVIDRILKNPDERHYIIYATEHQKIFGCELENSCICLQHWADAIEKFEYEIFNKSIRFESESHYDPSDSSLCISPSSDARMLITQIFDCTDFNAP